jgi:hypothetical protein
MASFGPLGSRPASADVGGTLALWHYIPLPPCIVSGVSTSTSLATNHFPKILISKIFYIF